MRAWVPWLPALLIAVLIAVYAGAAGAETGYWFTRTRFTLESGFGYDNNVYELNERTGDAVLLPFSGDLRHDVYRSSANRFRLYAGLWGSRYVEVGEDANTTTLRLKAAFQRKLFDASVGRLDLELAGIWRKHNQAYMSRIAGEEFTVDVDDEEISLRDRFNSSTLSGEIAADYRSKLGIEVVAAAEIGERNYGEDYDDIATVESLDYGFQIWRFELIRPTGWGRIRGAYEYAKREYREYSAIDSSGALVEDVQREYQHPGLFGDLDIKLSKAWQLTGRVRYKVRRDQYVGYYDYDQWVAGPSIEGSGLGRYRLRASYSWSETTYPRAHVSLEPDLPLRKEVMHLADAEVSYGMSRALSVFLGGQAVWYDSRNELYTYDRLRTWLGVRYTGGWR